MNKIALCLLAASGVLLSFAPTSSAAPKDYQVTGPIVSMTDTTIVVKKGTDDWEVMKDATLKPADGSELKVGDKITIHYTMMAKSIETKPAKAEKKPAAAPKA